MSRGAALCDTQPHKHTHTSEAHENTRNTQASFIHGPSIAFLIFTVPLAPLIAGMVAVVDVDVMPANRKRRSTGGDLHKSTQTTQHDTAQHADGTTWQ